MYVSLDKVQEGAMTTTVAPPAPQTVVTGIMDGDGHIRERDEDLYPCFGATYPWEVALHQTVVR